MKAVVFHRVGGARLEDVPEPEIQEETDAIVRLTASATCRTDLHFIRGTMVPMKKGTIFGHDGVGIVEKTGRLVRNVNPGDRVLVPSTIACGTCVYCRAGYYSQCDRVNPQGRRAGTAFFGGPESSGAFDGLRAEKARIPFAHVGLIKLPDEITDDQAILMSDIFPTGYFGADLAEIDDGDSVAVFGCGPVGQFVIASAKLMGAGRIFAIDAKPDHLRMAQRQAAEIIDFDAEDPVQTLLALTDDIGVDRAIVAVGIDAPHPHHGPLAATAREQAEDSRWRQTELAPQARPGSGQWNPGGPTQAFEWAVDALAKAGTLAIIGVDPSLAERFPFGKAMNKNLTINMGNCNHQKYLPHLIGLVRSGTVDPVEILSRKESLTNLIAAYRAFDRREPGRLKAKLEP